MKRYWIFIVSILTLASVLTLGARSVSADPRTEVPVTTLKFQDGVRQFEIVIGEVDSESQFEEVSQGLALFLQKSKQLAPSDPVELRSIEAVYDQSGRSPDALSGAMRFLDRVTDAVLGLNVKPEKIRKQKVSVGSKLGSRAKRWMFMGVRVAFTAGITTAGYISSGHSWVAVGAASAVVLLAASLVTKNYERILKFQSNARIRNLFSREKFPQLFEFLENTRSGKWVSNLSGARNWGFLDLLFSFAVVYGVEGVFQQAGELSSVTPWWMVVLLSAVSTVSQGILDEGVSSFKENFKELVDPSILETMVYRQGAVASIMSVSALLLVSQGHPVEGAVLFGTLGAMGVRYRARMRAPEGEPLFKALSNPSCNDALLPVE